MIYALGKSFISFREQKRAAVIRTLHMRGIMMDKVREVDRAEYLEGLLKYIKGHSIYCKFNV